MRRARINGARSNVEMGVRVVPIEQGQDVGVTFEAFYREEHARQVRRAFLLCGSNETANDIVHDAMVEVYRRWDELERPGAYLGTAVVNRCRDRARHSEVRARKMRAIATEDVTPEAVTADDIALDRALAALPFNQRAAIVLRYYADLSTNEIAALLDCRPGSVGPWIARGLTALRKELS